MNLIGWFVVVCFLIRTMSVIGRLGLRIKRLEKMLDAHGIYPE